MTVFRSSPGSCRSWRAAIASTLLLFALACGNLAPGNARYRPGRFEFDWPAHAALQPSHRMSASESLSLDTELLIIKLQDASVLEAVRRANVRNSAASLGTIMQVDEQWRDSDPSDPVVTSRIDSACSRSLQLLRDANSDFIEILVTDSTGLNVCQTRMTDHYYQGDKAWWRQCVEQQRLSHSRIAYDEEEGELALSIFAPVLDPSTGQAIGVSRALLRRQLSARQRGSSQP